MSLQEVKEQAFKLSVSDRLALVNLIIKSLQSELNNKPDLLQQQGQSSANISGSSIRGNLGSERTDLMSRMRGFLRTDKPAPTDSEVQAMLEERLVEKFLQ